MTEGRQAILCVDDEAVILLAMRQELRRRFGASFEIETAMGADAARAAIVDTEAEGGTVVLVICDWFMPGQRGDEFLAGLRSWRPGIKAILMTGQVDEQAMQKAKEDASIYAFLRKPWRPDVLIKAVEECLASSPRRT